MHKKNDPFAVSLTPELILRAYSFGVFPMAESATSQDLFWVDPEQRGIIPLDGLHISRSLRKTLRSGRYRVTTDKAFTRVIAACAMPADGRTDTWINDDITRLFTELFYRGYGHSVETWEGDKLVGGLYGLALGGAFFGESMFSTAPDASKVALVHLVERLNAGGFRLLDTQFLTDHLASMGGVEIPRAEYQARLSRALEVKADFDAWEGR